MTASTQDDRRWARFLVVAGVLAGLAPSQLVLAAPALIRVSQDPYTNPSSQHRTQVESDTFSYGATIVATFQVGRFYSGGASNIGWATSTDRGETWTKGFLPGITKYKGGSFDRVSDPSVAYDVRHKTWIISSLALMESPSVSGIAVIANRSSDGGLTWSEPVVIARVPAGGSLDKNWTVCDTWPTSPYYGHCYTQWDDHADNNRIRMSTSVDGGRTWGPALTTADNATGLGGQPVVKPSGTVVVPIGNANLTSIQSFRSTNGGASWTSTLQIAKVYKHKVAGGVRAPPLPSAEVDAAGKVYVVWQDCRFRTSCSANDIVMTTSRDGVTWSLLKRIPIDGTASGVDHFIPGIGVARTTSGTTARLGITYYYYPAANCTSSTCRLKVGFVSSSNGGANWSRPVTLAGPMSLSWLPATSQGRMFGDYTSTSLSAGKGYTVIPVANPPSNGVFDVAMYAPSVGLGVGSTTSGAAVQEARGTTAEPPLGGGATTARTLN